MITFRLKTRHRSSVKVDISTRVVKPSRVLRQNLSEGLLFVTLLGIPQTIDRDRSGKVRRSRFYFIGIIVAVS
jgi:hypothetical protein